MATMDGPFATWLSQAGLRESKLTADQVGVLKAAFHFREKCGDDYYSTRILSHFLLNAGTALPVIDELNAVNHRLPWLDNRRLVMSLTPDGKPRAGP